MENIYKENGYKNRADYLESLAAEHGISIDEVETISSMLGPDEDFDGLVTSLEDYSAM